MLIQFAHTSSGSHHPSIAPSQVRRAVRNLHCTRTHAHELMLHASLCGHIYLAQQLCLDAHVLQLFGCHWRDFNLRGVWN